jgi:hypothetical protein
VGHSAEALLTEGSGVMAHAIAEPIDLSGHLSPWADASVTRNCLLHIVPAGRSDAAGAFTLNGKPFRVASAATAGASFSCSSQHG